MSGRLAPFPIPSRAKGWTPSWFVVGAGPAAAPWVFASYESTGSTNHLARFDTEGATGWNITENQPTRLITNDTGILTVSSWDKPRRYDAATGTQDWEFTAPVEFEDAGGFVQSNDAAHDGAGGAFVALQHPDNDTSVIYHVDNTGAGTHLYDVDRVALGMASAIADSIELSSDGSVLFVMVLDNVDNGPVELLGVSVSTGGLLWREAILTGIDAGPTQATIRRVPGGDTLITALPGFTAPSNLGRVVVQRLEFASGVASEPAVSWSVFVTGSSEESQVSALAVASDGVLVGYGRSDEGGGDSHIATRLGLDGVVAWRFSSPDYAELSVTVSFHGVAIAGERVVLGVSGDWPQFPSWGAGLVLVDWLSGARVVAGSFPLEAASVHGVGGPVGP